MNGYFDKISDILMFRSGMEESPEGEYVPIQTTGSIIWGIILRSTLIFILSFVFLEFVQMREHIWIALFLLWFGAIYPGWKQFQVFNKQNKEILEDTLCGSCRNFDPTSQLCKIMDEHVTKNYIPCEGLNWEPKSFS
jgi:hypothetical protein